MNINKYFLEEVVWQQTNYVETSADDFGLALTSDALLYLGELDECTNKLVNQFVLQFSSVIQAAIVEQLEQGGDMNTELISNCTNIDTSFADDPEMSLEHYFDNLFQLLENLRVSSGENGLSDLKTLRAFLEFVEAAKGSVTILPQLWVLPLKNLQIDIKQQVLDGVINAASTIADIIETFSLIFETFVFSQCSQFVDGTLSDNSEVKQMLNGLKTVDFSFADNDSDLETYFYKLQSVIQQFGGRVSNATTESIQPLAIFISRLETDFDSTVINRLQIIQPVKVLWPSILKSTEGYYHKLRQSAQLSIQQIGGNIVQQWEDEIALINDISDKYRLNNEKMAQLSTTTESIEIALSDSSNGFADILSLIQDTYSHMANNTDTKINDIVPAEVFEILSSEWKLDSWIEPHLTGLVRPFEASVKVTHWLRLLFEDLSQEGIQSGKNGNFYDWWRNITDITEKFEEFYEKIAEEGFTASNSYNLKDIQQILDSSPAEVARLELLLDFTLGPGFCETSTSMPNYLSMRDILKCPQKLQNGTLALIALNTFFLDADFNMRDIYPKQDINLAIISPKIILSGGAIDLSGNFGISGDQFNPGNESTDGENGGLGYPAGRFYGIFDTVDLPSVDITGEIGGAGQPGMNGGNPSRRSAKSFNAESTNDCDAYIGGGIQIRVFANSCNNGTCDSDSCKCHAGDYGVNVTIDGPDPLRGLAGGKGGDGGDGGFGGQSYVIMLSTQDPLIENGTQGISGNAGEGGLGGSGGETTDLHVNVDDLGVWGSKYCWENTTKRYTDVSRKKGEAGVKGHDGISPLPNPELFIPVDPMAFSNFYLKFKEGLKDLLINEFVHNFVSDVLKKYDDHSLLL